MTEVRLPLDLPDMTRDFPGVALIPILSDSRGVSLVVRKWMRKNRLPDAIVIEHPRYAGGHLGATRAEEIRNGDMYTLRLRTTPGPPAPRLFQLEGA